MGLIQLKINNSKQHAVHGKQWKDPGAKLYDQCLNAFYCQGDVPCDTKQLNKAMKDGTYKQWSDFLKEVYLIAPINEIKNSPYGVTPYSRSRCKYPHHVIRNGELVLSVPGIKRAWDMTFYQKSMTPEVKRHLNRHLKELGIEPFFHHGQLYWKEEAESWKQIESNFKGIYSYLNEQLGINLSEDLSIFNESYDPPLEYDKLPDHLKGDPIHSWRAKNGIELIHKEPTIKELNRIWNNWQQMTDDQKRISDQKSYELFGKNNADHYKELLQSYADYENQIQISNGVNTEDYIRPLNIKDVTGEHFISWFFKMDEFENDKPENFDFNILVNDKLIQNYCYGYFIDMKLEGIIRTRYNSEQNSYAISMLFVNTDKWRSGIGDSLIKYVVSKFGDHTMTLRVFALNHKAISLYEKYGFQKFKTDIYQDGPDSDPKFVGQEIYLMKRDAIQKFKDNCDNMTDLKCHILTVEDLEKYKISEEELNAIKSRFLKEGTNMFDEDDDLDWIESYLTEEGEDISTPPSMPEEVKEESLPKKTDKVESSKNGVRRKNLYIEFIKWCKEYNPKNTFGSIFDKDAFNVTYPFIPDEMRYFYRLANPMLCVLGGNLTFFAAAELRKINAKNSHLNEMMIFAATNEDVRVFNIKDKKVYRGTEENGTLKLNEVLGDTFDTYLQKMINKGDILNAPIEESTEFEVEN